MFWKLIASKSSLIEMWEILGVQSWIEDLSSSMKRLKINEIGLSSAIFPPGGSLNEHINCPYKAILYHFSGLLRFDFLLKNCAANVYYDSHIVAFIRK